MPLDYTQRKMPVRDEIQACYQKAVQAKQGNDLILAVVQLAGKCSDPYRCTDAEAAVANFNAIKGVAHMSTPSSQRFKALITEHFGIVKKYFPKSSWVDILCQLENVFFEEFRAIVRDSAAIFKHQKYLHYYLSDAKVKQAVASAVVEIQDLLRQYSKQEKNSNVQPLVDDIDGPIAVKMYEEALKLPRGRSVVRYANQGQEHIRDPMIVNKCVSGYITLSAMMGSERDPLNGETDILEIERFIDSTRSLCLKRCRPKGSPAAKRVPPKIEIAFDSSWAD